MREILSNINIARLNLARLIVLTLVAAAIVVNVLEFQDIDKETRHNFSAIHNYETGNIFEVGISYDNSSRRWMAPFYYIGELHPESTFILPDRPLTMWFSINDGLMSFGRARQLIFRQYDPATIVDEGNWDDYKVDISQLAPRDTAIEALNERFTIFRRAEGPRVFVVGAPAGHPLRNDPVVFVDIELLSEEQRAALGDGL